MTGSASAGTKRHDGDSWDLASSVGATATAVAARRALASKGPNPLIDDPYAEPLVNAVGVDAFIRMMNGEIDLDDEDDPAFTPQRLSEGMAVRTRFFDSFFLAAAEAGCAKPSSWPPGWTPALTGCNGPPGTWSTRSTSRRLSNSRPGPWLISAPATAGRRAVGIDLRDDWPAAARQRIRPEPANGLDRRRPAGVPTAGRTGPPVRQHHRAQRRRQPGRHRVCPGYP